MNYEISKQKFKEIDGKMKLFHRLIISYQDFQQCYDIANLILKEKLHYKRKNLRGKPRARIRILLEALNCAMILSYCRPFSGNDKKIESKIPDLPGRFLRLFNKDEKEIHNIVVNDRNKVLAHSDSDAWNLRPHYRKDMPRVLIPLHYDTKAPLLEDAITKLKDMAIKQMDYVYRSRLSLEKELSDYFVTVEYDDEGKLINTTYTEAYKEILKYIE